MLDQIWTLLSVACAIIGATWGAAWWLSKQFSDVRRLIHSKTEQLEKFILDKLEYHEKHDDQRFQTISNDLWVIRVRNAALDWLDL